ncbi:MAG TPA: hypothetical protein VMW95_09245 [Desulfobacterales bacterium]|nr:hypothetical protein [Desulfobacterales bacterium]
MSSAAGPPARVHLQASLSERTWRRDGAKRGVAPETNRIAAICRQRAPQAVSHSALDTARQEGATEGHISHYFEHRRNSDSPFQATWKNHLSSSTKIEMSDEAEKE